MGSEPATVPSGLWAPGQAGGYQSAAYTQQPAPLQPAPGWASPTPQYQQQQQQHAPLPFPAQQHFGQPQQQPLIQQQPQAPLGLPKHQKIESAQAAIKASKVKHVTTTNNFSGQYTIQTVLGAVSGLTELFVLMPFRVSVDT